MRKADLSKNHFKKWMKSANSSTYASFVAAQEIVRHGKPFTDREYIKESFIKISKHLFMDIKNKSEIVQKIRDMSLCKDCQRRNHKNGRRHHQTAN